MQDFSELGGCSTQTSPQVLLTIAGFDPSSGAGVTADLQTFLAHGCFGTAATTALTVQSTLGVRRWQAVAPDLLADTLNCLHEDLTPAGVKIGMLGDAATLRVTANYLKRLPAGIPVVLDPVLTASQGEASGRALLRQDALLLLDKELLPYVTWTCPNLEELAAMTALPVTCVAEMEEAAYLLIERHPKLSVIATGGHLGSPDDLVAEAGQRAHWLRGHWQQTRNTHGTGCAFSSALLCGLVAGRSGVEAAAGAKHFVAEAMRRAPSLGRGRGPLNLLWPLRSEV